MPSPGFQRGAQVIDPLAGCALGGHDLPQHLAPRSLAARGRSQQSDTRTHDCADQNAINERKRSSLVFVVHIDLRPRVAFQVLVSISPGSGLSKPPHRFWHCSCRLRIRGAWASGREVQRVPPFGHLIRELRTKDE